MPGLENAQTVVMDLLNDLEGCYRTVVVDNFFISISLVERLLEHNTYLIGTLRSNRAGSVSEVPHKNRRHGEVYELLSKEGVRLIIRKDKKNVLMISTRPSDSATVVDPGQLGPTVNERFLSYLTHFICPVLRRCSVVPYTVSNCRKRPENRVSDRLHDGRNTAHMKRVKYES